MFFLPTNPLIINTQNLLSQIANIYHDNQEVMLALENESAFYAYSQIINAINDFYASPAFRETLPTQTLVRFDESSVAGIHGIQHKTTTPDDSASYAYNLILTAYTTLALDVQRRVNETILRLAPSINLLCEEAIDNADSSDDLNLIKSLNTHMFFQIAKKAITPQTQGISP